MNAIQTYSSIAMTLTLTLVIGCQPGNGQKEAAQTTTQFATAIEAPDDPIKRAPTQEELIREHKVKSVRALDDDQGGDVTTYDENGRMILYHSFTATSSYLTSYTYETDEEGKVLQKVCSANGGKLIYEYQYDDAGREISNTVTYSPEQRSTTHFEYDDASRTKTKISSYGTSVTFFDGRGLEEKVVSYDPEGQLESTVVYTNDEKGNRIRSETTISGIHTVEQMSYDARGQLLRMERSGRLAVVLMYTYDKKGLCTKREREQDSMLSSTVYSYEYF